MKIIKIILLLLVITFSNQVSASYWLPGNSTTHYANKWLALQAHCTQTNGVQGVRVGPITYTPFASQQCNYPPPDDAVFWRTVTASKYCDDGSPIDASEQVLCPEEQADCSNQTGTHYYAAEGRAPGSICTDQCRYLASAVTETPNGFQGWYTGNGEACDGTEQGGTALPKPDPDPVDCPDPQFPLSVEGAPGVCLPNPDDPLNNQDQCYEFLGVRYCANDGEDSCSIYTSKGLPCPDEAKNCTMQGGRIVCPAEEPPPSPEEIPPETVCTKVGDKTLCFKEGKPVETEQTQVTENPDGTTTVETTTESNIAGTGSTTTTTTTDANGNSTTVVVENPTASDTDANGKTDSEERNPETGKTTGGVNCEAPPVCTGGDERQCAILRQTWETRCGIESLTDLGDFDMNSVLDGVGAGSALVDGDGYSELNISDLWQPPTYQGGNACPSPQQINLSNMTVTIPYDLFCSWLDIVRPVFLLVMTFFAFRYFFKEVV